MAGKPYKLSCSLFGHTADVRSLTVSSNGKILSGSRDLSARLWEKSLSDPTTYTLLTSFTGHSNFVSSVCILPATGEHQEGIIVTGSNDKLIRLFDPLVQVPFKTISGHTNTVCKLTAAVNGWAFLSSSWDQTARAWRDNNGEWVSTTFTGHSAAVWSVCQLSSGLIVTASADKTLRIHDQSGKLTGTLTGHTDCVRDVVAASDEDVLSVSNDATVRLWNVLSAQCLNTYYGHGHYIYSIALLPGVGWVTSSEDRTVKIWTSTGESDSLALPSMSVWAVAVLPNRDIVTGTNDGVIRVFTTDTDRTADDQTLAAFEEQVAKFAAEASQDIGGVKMADLPGKEALLEPGRNDGQTKIVREGDKAMAYSWSAAEQCWQQIGDVVGASGTDAGETGRPIYEGKEYDYVFNVDIDDGAPAIKLPYNRTEDPWVAAQNFIHKNDLPQSYLEQVANFIVTNSSQNHVQPMPVDYVDPFTGATRYIPQSNGQPTGDSKSRSGPAVNTLSTKYIPQREYLRFDQANISAMKDKLLLLNKDRSLGADDKAVDELFTRCEPGRECSLSDIATLECLLKWPADAVFPVLDLTRLLIRQPLVSHHLCTDDFLTHLQSYLSESPNNMLVLRICSNMMSSQAGEGLASRHRLKLITFLLSIPSPYSKLLQVALATLLLNLVVLIRKSDTPDGRQELLLASRELLSSFVEQEALFRGLVALGTLLADAPDRNKTVEPFLNLLHKHSADSAVRIKECANEILSITR